MKPFTIAAFGLIFFSLSCCIINAEAKPAEPNSGWDYFITIFERDLDKYIDLMEQYDESKLWETPEGINNSGGVLAQHIVDNLNYFIGHSLGNTGYQRNRQASFRPSDKSLNDLIQDLKETKKMIRTVLSNLEDSQLQDPFPVRTPVNSDTNGMMIHLFGHLNYHLGQLNYIQRVLH